MDRPLITLRTELRDTLRLAGPIVLGQVGHMSMGLVDTLVAGRLGTNALAGLGLAANFYWTFTSICLGCLLALDTYFAQAVGARDERALNHYLAQSFWSCAIVALASTLCVIGGSWIYLKLAPASSVRDAFEVYLRTIIWCLPSLFIFFVLQRYWQAQHRVYEFTVIILGANALNLLACLALGLGHWGFPRLEVRGLALATVISRNAMLAAALGFTVVQLRWKALRISPVDWPSQSRLFKLGLPAAGHAALEIGAFTIATFIVGALGAVPLAAHNVCLMMAAFTFMFPLGFSSAAAVRVGMFIGARQPERARLAGWLCIGVAIAVMGCFAIGYLCFSRTLLGWFTTDPMVIGLGMKILLLVALFQIADGTQVSTTGALRGLGNTRSAMVANLIGHYPIGLALSMLLCFGFGFGVVGIWAGLALGLIAVAAMVLRAWRKATWEVANLTPIAADLAATAQADSP